jgi:phospholipid/cholesterol/gamma-HCH transport system ATP-binding protein
MQTDLDMKPSAGADPGKEPEPGDGPGREPDANAVPGNAPLPEAAGGVNPDSRREPEPKQDAGPSLGKMAEGKPSLEKKAEGIPSLKKKAEGNPSPGKAPRPGAGRPVPGSKGVPAVELADVSLSYGSKTVLDGFSLSVPAGSKISVVGESSSGKSSLFKVMVGLVRPDSGTAKLFGKDLLKASLRDLESLRRRVGMQFQAGALFDSLDVQRNLALASEESSRGRGPAAGEGRILDMLERVGLRRAALENPASLSGGMRKRAAIARALIVNPELALFDEPTAGLDPITSASIIRLLNELSADSGAAMLLATTDLDVARRFSGDIVIMHLGRIRARGGVGDHLASRDPYIMKFLSRFNRLKAL